MIGVGPIRFTDYRLSSPDLDYGWTMIQQADFESTLPGSYSSLAGQTLAGIPGWTYSADGVLPFTVYNVTGAPLNNAMRVADGSVYYGYNRPHWSLLGPYVDKNYVETEGRFKWRVSIPALGSYNTQSLYNPSLGYTSIASIASTSLLNRWHVVGFVNNTTLGIWLNASGGDLATPGTSANASGTIAAPAATNWYDVEVRYSLDASSGYIQVWWNNTKVCEYTGDTTFTSSVGRYQDRAIGRLYFTGLSNYDANTGVDYKSSIDNFSVWRKTARARNDKVVHEQTFESLGLTEGAALPAGEYAGWSYSADFGYTPVAWTGQAGGTAMRWPVVGSASLFRTQTVLTPAYLSEWGIENAGKFSWDLKVPTYGAVSTQSAHYGSWPWVPSFATLGNGTRWHSFGFVDATTLGIWTNSTYGDTYSPPSAATVTGTFSQAAGTWYPVVIKYHLHASSGFLELWWGGSKICEVTGDTTFNSGAATTLGQTYLCSAGNTTSTTDTNYFSGMDNIRTWRLAP